MQASALDAVLPGDGCLRFVYVILEVGVQLCLYTIITSTLLYNVAYELFWGLVFSYDKLGNFSLTFGSLEIGFCQ